jgi:hypothetical protein
MFDDDDGVMRNQVALVQFGRRLVLGVRNSDLESVIQTTHIVQ